MQEVVESCFGFFTAQTHSVDHIIKVSEDFCSFRWLKSSLKRVIESTFLSSSLRFPDTWAQFAKKDDSKVLVLTGKDFIVFRVELWTKYILKLSHGVR